MIREDNKKNIIECILVIYAFSLIVSKFGIHLFGGILAIFLIIYIFIKKELNVYSIFIFIFLLGIVTQLFSIGGVKSSIIYFYKNYFLLITPFLIYYLNKKNISEKLLKAVEIALFIGILKSFHNFYKFYNLTYTSNIRVDSFFDIGRWGIVLVMSLLLILPNLYKKNIFSWIVFICGIISLFLNNSRGPMLSFILGVLIFFILGKKIKSILGIILIVSFCSFISINNSFLPIKEFSKRINSILISDSGGNGARIFMWKENINFMLDGFRIDNKKLFFMGTGIANRKELFREYIGNKDKYINLKEDIKVGVSFEDAHNMYLNMFTQMGFIYSSIYYVAIIYFTLLIFKNYLRNKNEYTLSCLSATIAFYFCGIFYGYSFTYETFLFFFIFSLGLLERKKL